MAIEVEKIMVLKDTEELPSHYKYLGEFAPQPREKVVVMESEQRGAETYLRVRFSVNSNVRFAVLGVRCFRTIKKDKLRQRILSQPRTPHLDRVLKLI